MPTTNISNKERRTNQKPKQSENKKQTKKENITKQQTNKYRLCQ